MVDLCTFPTGISDNLKRHLTSLCQCQKAVESAKKIADQNSEILKTNSENGAKFAKENRDWENKEGQYAKFKGYNVNTPFWSKECWGRPGGFCSEDVGNGDWHCAREAQDKGSPFGWEYKDTGERQRCKTCFQTFRCARPATALKQWAEDYEIAAPEKPKELGLDNSDIKIQCCSNYMGGDNLLNNIQTCKQEIQEQAKTIIQKEVNAELTTETPPTTEAPQNIKSYTTKAPQNMKLYFTESTGDNTKIYIGIGSILSTICLFIISLLLLFAFPQ